MIKIFFFLLLIAPLFSCKTSTPQFKTLNDTAEERLQSTRWDTAGTTISNEARLDLFMEAAQNAGSGIYLGVGSIQNFTLAAWAKSDFIYLMDFTDIVVKNNKIHIAFMKESAEPSGYLKLWDKKSDQQAREVLKKYYASAKDYTEILDTLAKTRPLFKQYQGRMKTATSRYKYRIYYQDKAMYTHLRTLALFDRIRPVKGNLLGQTTLQSIGSALKNAGHTINIIYLSNAEEYRIFMPYPGSFIKNISSLPGNEKSVVLRTLSVYHWTHNWAPGEEIFPDPGFHYGQQSLDSFRTCLNSAKNLYIYHMFKKGKTVKNGLTRLSCTT